MAAKNTAAKTAQAEPAACTCSQFATEDGRTTGCAAETKRLFAPGHDAKLKSFLIRMGAEGVEIIRTTDGIASSADASTHAAKFAFGHMVAAGITRAEGKAAAKAQREAAKNDPAKKAAKKALRQAKQAMTAALDEAKADAGARGYKREPQEVTAKVGRWERTGTVEGDTFTYTDAKGATKTTTKFQLV
ncbi:hypothetical protein ACH4KO_00500 [Streptomyces anulatus]|uniref:Uncharacterized protein n=1 Tax=Streptomyces microflavus DSM 40593 TaxID=1303692 RepID=N0D551_STRMI|nr:hypothetical protein [Streptomyces microflavus]AGK80457.1 hypothetical protein SFUL_5569 [Streptomyces microflavus DSM 40593]